VPRRVSRRELGVASETEMEGLGGRLAAALRPGLIVFLRGDLGAGKTTLVRGVLRALGHHGVVKSPTYTLVEPYECGGLAVFHFDLYRLRDAEELETIGIRDYMDGTGVCLIEWPERGETMLAVPDLEVTITRQDGRRRVELSARTELGTAALESLA
jgi:tRNA threonylcarbamoyladenosine biosynthesis protein TsaE